MPGSRKKGCLDRQLAIGRAEWRVRAQRPRETGSRSEVGSQPLCADSAEDTRSVGCRDTYPGGELAGVHRETLGPAGTVRPVSVVYLPPGFEHLREKVQGLCVLWPDDGEVAPVQGGHVGQHQPFRDGDD